MANTLWAQTDTGRRALGDTFPDANTLTGVFGGKCTARLHVKHDGRRLTFYCTMPSHVGTLHAAGIGHGEVEVAWLPVSLVKSW